MHFKVSSTLRPCDSRLDIEAVVGNCAYVDTHLEVPPCLLVVMDEFVYHNLEFVGGHLREIVIVNDRSASVSLTANDIATGRLVMAIAIKRVI
jgi:hypothetical protein